MIALWHDPHPDELLYGVFARLARRAGYPSLKSITQELFGSTTVIASVPFASHLEHLVAHLRDDNGYTAEALIAEHTLLPYYRPFLPVERVQQLVQDMRGAGGPALHMRAGIMASMISGPTHFRFCPVCVEEDRMLYGEAYWHRIHQVPGVYLCPMHAVWLEASHTQIRHRTTRHAFIAAEDNVRAGTSRSIQPSRLAKILVFLAQASEWLLRQFDLAPGLEALHQRYQKALIERDLATWSGRIWMTALQEGFVTSYPKGLLSLLHCNLERETEDNWLARLVRRPDGAQHPLRHLLLMHYLSCTPETFFADEATLHPFGYGPWPCLNPASYHYQQPTIQQCEITYPASMHGKPTGTFACECGFVYSRSGPDTMPQDYLRRGKLIQVGPVWEQELRNLWQDLSLSVNTIARRLGVDPLTVKRYALQLGLQLVRQNVSGTLHLRSPKRRQRMLVPRLDEAAREKHRTIWQSVLQAHPEKTVPQLRALTPGTFMWLYRHDKAWLQTMRRQLQKRRGSSRVKWEQRDAWLSGKVVQAAGALQATLMRPGRITIAALGRYVKQLALLQAHLDKLPLTAQALSEVVESRESYAARRIRWVVTTCMKERRCPERWELIKEAGIERLLECPVVHAALDESLLLLQKEFGLLM